MLFVTVTTVNAQSVTKIHENDIMNQFLTMETGAGALTPAAYYNTFHKSYQRDANVRNKLIYRTSVMAAVNEEKAPAEKIDSDYVARAKIEALNIESRSKATDITWFSEKAKINGKLEIFNRNISRIVTSGGTSEDYRTWRNIYNCIETAIKYTQDSYLDMGQRKRSFLPSIGILSSATIFWYSNFKYGEVAKEHKNCLPTKPRFSVFHPIKL